MVSVHHRRFSITQEGDSATYARLNQLPFGDNQKHLINQQHPFGNCNAGADRYNSTFAANPAL